MDIEREFRKRQTTRLIIYRDNDIILDSDRDKVFHFNTEYWSNGFNKTIEYELSLPNFYNQESKPIQKLIGKFVENKIVSLKIYRGDLLFESRAVMIGLTAQDVHTVFNLVNSGEPKYTDLRENMATLQIYVNRPQKMLVLTHFQGEEAISYSSSESQEPYNLSRILTNTIGEDGHGIFSIEYTKVKFTNEDHSTVTVDFQYGFLDSEDLESEVVRRIDMVKKAFYRLRNPDYSKTPDLPAVEFVTMEV